MASVLEEFQQKEGIAIDVGAHIGYHTREMAKNFGHVIAMEADPQTFQYLARNTADLGNVTCMNAAVSSSDGVATFKRDLISTRSKILPQADPLATSSFSTPVRSLDSVTEDGSLPVALIKIDVEGHEREVLSGSRNLIKHRKPVIVYEDHTGETTDWILMNFSFYDIQRVDATNLIAVPKPAYKRSNPSLYGSLA